MDVDKMWMGMFTFVDNNVFVESSKGFSWGSKTFGACCSFDFSLRAAALPVK